MYCASHACIYLVCISQITLKSTIINKTTVINIIATGKVIIAVRRSARMPISATVTVLLSTVVSVTVKER